jgi:hypothetical protein
VTAVGNSTAADRTLADAYFAIVLLSGGGLTGLL